MSELTTLSDITGLEPGRVWRFFVDLSGVPRPSKQEERIRKHVRGVAEGMDFVVREDSVGNLLVEVPATSGCESAPIIVLQSHLDMVCEKNSDVVHDFDNDPIQLVLDEAKDGERIVRAKGTTLGADNGMGVAMALAAAADPEVKHGPLELFFTVDEEAGMTGANNVEPGFFKGRRLLNLDSEEDDRIYIGCAGGCDTNLTWAWKYSAAAVDAEIVRVSVSGLRGGHSGCDIQENRGNAIKLLTRVLLRGACGTARVVTFTGGSKRNAIPREAWATLTGPVGMTDALTRAAAEVAEEAAHQSAEPNAVIKVEPADGVSAALSVEDTATLLGALAALPSGVLGMHPSVPGLVETSNNLSTVVSTVSDAGDAVTIVAGLLSRSSSASWNRETVSQIAGVGRLAGAKVATANGYPAWEPNLDSPTLAVCRRVYERLFGEPATVAAIHAGLECGLIGERIAGIDMVSFGPRIEGAHSPDEVVFVDSVKKSWDYLVAVLAELACA